MRKRSMMDVATLMSIAMLGSGLDLDYSIPGYRPYVHPNSVKFPTIITPVDAGSGKQRRKKNTPSRAERKKGGK